MAAWLLKHLKPIFLHWNKLPELAFPENLVKSAADQSLALVTQLSKKSLCVPNFHHLPVKLTIQIFLL